MWPALDTDKNIGFEVRLPRFKSWCEFKQVTSLCFYEVKMMTVLSFKVGWKQYLS